MLNYYSQRKRNGKGYIFWHAKGNLIRFKPTFLYIRKHFTRLEHSRWLPMFVFFLAITFGYVGFDSVFLENGDGKSQYISAARSLNIVGIKMPL